MPALRRACSYAFSEGVPRRSFLVAIVVGTILNLINQGDAVLGAASINWIKVVRLPAPNELMSPSTSRFLSGAGSLSAPPVNTAVFETPAERFSACVASTG